MKLPNKSFWITTLDNISNNLEINILPPPVHALRFAKDKCYYENNDCVLIADGLLLNKSELFCEYGLSEYSELLKLLLSDASLLKKFRGCFTGFVFDKNKKIGFAFGNQTGDVSIFYHYDAEKDKLIISNNFNELHKHVDKKYRKIDEQAAHYFMVFGFTIDDRTLCQGIKRLQAGKILKIESGSFSVERYHRFIFKPTNQLNHEDTLAKINELFRQAVKRCFDKDLEYGYTAHLADLSAGLDSRMTNWVAKDMGYTNIINISYSQSFSDEDRYTQILANKLQNQYYHKSIDDVSFIYDIDVMTELLCGFGLYCGGTGFQQWMDLINFESLGCEHTGQLGDAVLGTFHCGESSKIDPNTYRNSMVLKLRLGELEHFDNQEEYNLYTRASQGALGSHYIRNNYTYALSPFMDVDFMEFCCSIPYTERDKHKLYWAWIDKYYPEAAVLPSSRKRVTNKFASMLHYLKGKSNGAKIKVCRKLGLTKFAYSANGMNPYNYWYNTNPELRNFINEYYNTNSTLLSDNQIIKQECAQLFNSPVVLDKLMAISLLASVKRYCS